MGSISKCACGRLLCDFDGNCTQQRVSTDCANFFCCSVLKQCELKA